MLSRSPSVLFVGQRVRLWRGGETGLTCGLNPRLFRRLRTAEMLSRKPEITFSGFRESCIVGMVPGILVFRFSLY